MKLYKLGKDLISRSQYNDPLMRHLTEVVARELPSGRGKTLLDVGCGAGRTALAAGGKGYRVLGIDAEPKVIEIANQLATDLVEFKVADITKIKLANNNKFDVVVCCEVIEHVSNPQRLLKAASDALKETGLFVLTTPNDMGQWSILDDYGEHLTRFNKADLEKLFSSVGLEIKKMYTIGWPFMRFVVWTYDKMASFGRIKHGSHLKKGLFYGKIYPIIMDKLLKIDDCFNGLQRGTNWVIISRRR